MTPEIRNMFPETQLEPELVPDERYTPSSVFAPLHMEFRFDLDVCATAESAKCTRYFTARDNGLEQSWDRARVWCNPPYSDIGPWVHKAWNSNAADLVVMLLPAWTDRQWWQDLVEPYREGRGNPGPGPGPWRSPIIWRLTTRFIRGRIRFGFPGNPEGVRAGSPNFWSVLLIWKHQEAA